MEPARSMTNRHGVEGEMRSTGSHFGTFTPNPDGTETFTSNVPVFVPAVCLACRHFEPGEFDEYGSQWTPPYCRLNLYLPSRKGTCQKQDRYASATSEALD